MRDDAVLRRALPLGRGLGQESRTKHRSNTKIGRKVVHLTGNNAHQFQRSRSLGRHNVETGSASYVPNGNAYELEIWCRLQMEDEDPYRRDGPSTARSKVKVAMSRGASDS